MTGIDRGVQTFDKTAPEFPPALDLVAPVIGGVGLLVAAGFAAGGPWATSVLRLLVGAAFLGAVTDAMLLGHWYLVQPGLARAPLRELVRWTGYTWPVELVVLLLPTGMVSVLSGSIDDGYGGMLGLVLGGVRGDHHRARVRHAGGAEGAAVLRGDGGHRPALPGHPHRVRHGPGGPSRAQPDLRATILRRCRSRRT